MDITFIVGLVITLGTALATTAFAYGKLHGQIVALEKRVSDDKTEIKGLVDERKDRQSERDRRQDARTRDMEKKLETHTNDLSDLKVIMTKVSTNLEHVVKTVDALADSKG